MSPELLCSTSAARLRDTAKRFEQDLRALPADALFASPGGVARNPGDYAYEVAFVNSRLAQLIRGEDPGPWPFEGWATAPEELRSHDALVDAVRDSLEDLASTVEGLSAEAWSQQFPFFGGDRYPHEIAAFAVTHTYYHMGQLNLHQSILGDNEMHWN